MAQLIIIASTNWQSQRRSTNHASSKRILRVSAVVVMLCGVGQSQTLLTELTSHGIEFRDGVKVVLPPPIFTGEMSDERLEEAKTQLSGDDGWEKFARDSVVAPVSIKLEYVTDKEGTRVGHNVHSAFVVHAKLESLTDKDLMQQIFGKPESKNASGIKFVELAAGDLQAAGVEVPDAGPAADPNAGTQVSYLQVEYLLLEKISLKGVMRVERTATPGSTTLCWLLDPQFATHKELRGTWAKASVEGSEPKPYEGWGGYLKVSRIGAAPEVLLIESRMLLHELPEWFSGSNFVRSKMPLAIQEGARNFRRKLKKQ